MYHQDFFKYCDIQFEQFILVTRTWNPLKAIELSRYSKMGHWPNFVWSCSWWRKVGLLSLPHSEFSSLSPVIVLPNSPLCSFYTGYVCYATGRCTGWSGQPAVLLPVIGRWVDTVLLPVIGSWVDVSPKLFLLAGGGSSSFGTVAATFVSIVAIRLPSVR